MYSAFVQPIPTLAALLVLFLFLAGGSRSAPLTTVRPLPVIAPATQDAGLTATSHPDLNTAKESTRMRTAITDKAGHLQTAAGGGLEGSVVEVHVIRKEAFGQETGGDTNVFLQPQKRWGPPRGGCCGCGGGPRGPWKRWLWD